MFTPTTSISYETARLLTRHARHLIERIEDDCNPYTLMDVEQDLRHHEIGGEITVRELRWLHAMANREQYFRYDELKELTGAKWQELNDAFAAAALAIFKAEESITVDAQDWKVITELAQDYDGTEGYCELFMTIVDHAICMGTGYQHSSDDPAVVLRSPDELHAVVCAAEDVLENYCADCAALYAAAVERCRALVPLIQIA